VRYSLKIILQLAYRDSRRQRGRLLLFVAAMTIGIAALVAIQSFSDNLQRDIRLQAKNLLGADFVINGLTPPNVHTQQLIDSLGKSPDLTGSQVVNFLSMAYFPQRRNTRPVLVKAQRGNYPFYGTVETRPANAYAQLQKNEPIALLERTLMLQFALKLGDSIRIGERTYTIGGEVISAAGRNGAASSLAPAVWLPLSALDTATLLQRGSRVEYQFFFQQKSKKALPETKNWKKRLENDKYNLETVAERSANTGRAFGQLTNFLDLVGFIALLLGALGVASSVSIYIRAKRPTVAILRTLGASGRVAFQIFLTQIVAMSVVGAVLGASLGAALQYALPLVLKDFLPLENISTQVSFSAIGIGVATALSLAILFALLPLLAIRHVSPLYTLRTGFEETISNEKRKKDFLTYAIYALILALVLGFTYFLTRNISVALAFIAGVAVALSLLAATATLLMGLMRRLLPYLRSFELRQGIANLYRPNNQTLILMVSIGLGTMLVATLALTQGLLLRQVEFADSNQQPNLIIFDIQKSQRDSLRALVRQYQLPIIQEVPIITIRLEQLDGINRAQRAKDTTSTLPRWVFEREYRVTYRDTLTNSETLTSGEMPVGGGAKMPDGSVGITVAENFAQTADVKIGSKITFNVQGGLVNTTVVGIRRVDFNRVQTNFIVLFPTGVLEEVPAFGVIVTRVSSAEQSAQFQQTCVQRFSNVSVIDLTQILKTVAELLGKVSFVIRFMAAFSILTGLLVLVSALFLSRYQRVRESVLLRTLGATRAQILRINAVEYLAIGIFATLSGWLLALLATFLLARFAFRISFAVAWLPSLWLPLGVVALILLIGLLNSRSVLSKSPLAVLRAEV
jgi:putative ABC transport system permease protein